MPRISSRRDVLQFGALTSLLGAIGHDAWAQAQLESLKIITGFPPGGTSDAICRRVSEKIAPTSYAKAAFVENKTGAGGQIAVQYLRNAAPDGTTVLQTPMSMLGIYPHIYKKLPYDPVNDLMPVSLGCIFDFGFAVGPMVPANVKNIADFIAWCKANPKLANFCSPAAGSTPHFIGELLGKYANIELNHVAFRGTQPAILDEQGIKDFVFNEWFGFFVPAKTPNDILTRLNTALRAALAAPETVNGLATMGLEAQSSTPAELVARLKADTDKWGPLVKSIGFTAEG